LKKNPALHASDCGHPDEDVGSDDETGDAVTIGFGGIPNGDLEGRNAGFDGVYCGLRMGALPLIGAGCRIVDGLFIGVFVGAFHTGGTLEGSLRGSSVDNAVGT
jgi:hypothetical protein